MPQLLQKVGYSEGLAGEGRFMAADRDATNMSHAVGLRRLAIGLAQGLALYGMFKAAEQQVWPATDLATFQALLLPLLFAPLAAIHAESHLARRTYLLWLGTIVLVTAALGFFDGLRFGGPLDKETWEPGLLLIATATSAFIAEALVLAAHAEGRRIASYSSYFDAGWKHGVQVAAGAGFVGVLWLLLFLGSRLFELIGLKFLTDLIEEAWFAIPISAVALAIAIHLTDVRHSLVRGIRTLALTLLSWLLPLLVLIVAGFVLSLPLTGLQPLWDTNFAAALLLAVTAALIILINAAYQDGLPETQSHAVLRWVMMAGALLPAPLIVLAAYALTLRVQQYGWTAERVYALACIVVGACYATGYLVAAVRPNDLLKRLESTNVATSFVVLGVLLALFSPIADPAHIAVKSQVARLESGRITPDQFDYAYLRFEGGRYGADELKRMTTGYFDVAGAKEPAAQAMKLTNRYQTLPLARETLAANIVVGGGRELPESFAAQDWGSLTQKAPSDFHDCLQRPGQQCEAFFVDFDKDGTDEIILSADEGGIAPTLFRYDGALWSRVGLLPWRLACEDMKTLLRAGQATTLDSAWNDLDVGGLRMDVAVRGVRDWPDCPKT
jgi:hypothetical protein